MSSDLGKERIALLVGFCYLILDLFLVGICYKKWNRFDNFLNRKIRGTFHNVPLEFRSCLHKEHIRRHFCCNLGNLWDICHIDLYIHLFHSKLDRILFCMNFRHKLNCHVCMICNWFGIRHIDLLFRR